VDTVREPLLILDADLRVESANRAFCEAFTVEPQETEGELLYDVGDGQWDVPELRELLEEILPQETAFDDFELEHDFPELGQRRMLLNARELRRGESDERLILLAIEDAT
jgi:PAS domain-containing protein